MGLWSPNNLAWVLTQYATAKAGLILVNLNPGYRVGELEYAYAVTQRRRAQHLVHRARVPPKIPRSART